LKHPGDEAIALFKGRETLMDSQKNLLHNIVSIGWILHSLPNELVQAIVKGLPEVSHLVMHHRLSYY
jgi:hypothetical protein